MAWLGGWFDPELDELFRDEPELLETAHRLRAAHPEPAPDPRYRNRLRAQLMAEASSSMRHRSLRRRFWLGPAHVAWGGAGIGAVLIAATVITLLSGRGNDHRTVVAYSAVSAHHLVSPTDVITVAFNQQMDEAAVQAGVHIQPATQVTYSWQGNNLVITPVHHLAGNTPYTVTIDQHAVRTASGSTATAPINITFGTAPTAAATPPSLSPALLGPSFAGGGVLFAPDGSVISTLGTLSSPAITATPGPAETAAPVASARPTASAAPEGVSSSPSPATAPAVGVLEYPAGGGSPISLFSQPATAGAFSPNGRTLAVALDDGSGGSDIVVGRFKGSQTSLLTDTPNPVSAMTWASNGRLIYTTGVEIGSVDLSGATRSLLTLAAGAGKVTALSPGGDFAYIASPSGGGELLDLATNTGRLLAGAAGDVAFSGDGRTVAWVDESASPLRLLTEPVDRDAPATVSILDPTASVSAVTLDRAGDEVAYMLTPRSGAPELVIAQLPSGMPLAIGSAATQVAFSPDGASVAYVTGGASGPEVDLASIPGVTPITTTSQLPPAADSALEAFVDAQVHGDRAELTLLSGPGIDAVTSTPKHLSRAYIISTVVEQDGTVNASVELIQDPSPAHPTASVASEDLGLTRTADGQHFVVTSIDAGRLHDESTGPHVVRVATSTLAGVTVVLVSFDSDLNQGTVAGAITIVSPTGAVITSTVVYDPDSRTATVTLAGAPTGALIVEVTTSLRDVNGAAPALAFSTHIATG